jgi:hypothetical protein
MLISSQACIAYGFCRGKLGMARGAFMRESAEAMITLDGITHCIQNDPHEAVSAMLRGIRR